MNFLPPAGGFANFPQPRIQQKGGVRMSKVIFKCLKCGSGCLWFKPDESVLCTVCMAQYSKEEATICNKRKSKKSGS